MELKLITADEARALLDGTTPGPWQTRRGHTLDVGPTVIVESAPVDIDVAIVIETENPVDEHDALLCAAAPDLAHTVETLHQQLAAARAALRDIAARCDQCDRLATRKRGNPLLGRFYACDDDGHARVNSKYPWQPLPHAEALRAAEVSR